MQYDLMLDGHKKTANYTIYIWYLTQPLSPVQKKGGTNQRQATGTHAPSCQIVLQVSSDIRQAEEKILVSRSGQ